MNQRRFHTLPWQAVPVVYEPHHLKVVSSFVSNIYRLFLVSPSTTGVWGSNFHLFIRDLHILQKRSSLFEFTRVEFFHVLQAKLPLLHFNLRPLILLLQEGEKSLFDLFLVPDLWLTIYCKLQSSTAIPVISWFIISQSLFWCFPIIFNIYPTQRCSHYMLHSNNKPKLDTLESCTKEGPLRSERKPQSVGWGTGDQPVAHVLISSFTWAMSLVISLTSHKAIILTG